MFAFDQGILNGLLNARANWLPPEFNAHCLAECGVPRDVRAIHYTGSPNKLTSGRDVPAEVMKRLKRAGFAAKVNGDGVLAVRR